jgi:hypothetical protein
VYPNNRDERVSCVYANTPRAWCKYIWVVLSIFLLGYPSERDALEILHAGNIRNIPHSPDDVRRFYTIWATGRGSTW